MIAVVIPCFRVREHILDVLQRIGPECQRIYVVDDGCPERSGAHVEAQSTDPRVSVLHRGTNDGVGAATLTGYRQAIADGATIIVKLDGDGQMDPGFIPQLVAPIRRGDADYTKGNRLHDLESIREMPLARLIGNGLLSFITKASSGYWGIVDPTNGFTAIHARVAERLPLEKVSPGYFFESDMLFRLNVLRAVVRDVPMTAHYGGESSSLVIRRVVGQFLVRHAINLQKRILYNYFLHNFSVASLELLFGTLFLLFGGYVGVTRWQESLDTGIPATSGTVMLAALPVVMGTQLLLAFLAHDVQDAPREPVHKQYEI